MRCKKMLATREGYCLALVTIRRESNRSEVRVKERLWLTWLVFWWQQAVETARRVVQQNYGLVMWSVAVSELIGAGWKLAAAWVGVQVTLAGILLRSVGWALAPRMA